MTSQLISSTENNFSKGLVTEFTGLNFPENAATDTDNCVYTIVGDVTRRLGIDKELNGAFDTLSKEGSAVNSYKWNNAGGDGSTQIVVVQGGSSLFFYLSSASTQDTPVSTRYITSTTIIPFATGLTPDPATQECQFSDGNGYLFVYHPSCNPFYCTYVDGVIAANVINVQVRDFTGTDESQFAVNLRPTSLTNEHLYNLTNQGWTSGSPWLAHSTTSFVITRGASIVLTVEAGLTVTLGDIVGLYSNETGFAIGMIPQGTSVAGGNVTAYSGTSMTITMTGITDALAGKTVTSSYISPYNHGFINTWQTAIGNYPSNADVWWYFKDSANAFNPALTSGQVTYASGPAPKGHYLLNAFTLDRSTTSGIASLTAVVTSKRPRTGTWFQGRVWYAGVDDAQEAGGDSSFYTWTENIYFSQIVTTPSQFGQCYQTNDPTSETLFDLLPSDGGAISIQGSGAIYKLFPIQNGMLVFAANGIWFITGSQGIGFTANDYTITKISAVTSISSTSFVDVNGLPYFWNEDGIYAVQASKQGGLEVDPITVGTILQYYNEIPAASKRYARGCYHPIDYVIQWTFRSTDDSDNLNNRYHFDKILNFNTYNKAFYPYSVTGVPEINGVIYVNYPGSDAAPDPSIKYLVTLPQVSSNNFTFAEEYDTNYVDWRTASGTGISYDSFFVTGYKLHGKGQTKVQMPYIYVFSRADASTAYKIQGLWDYATSGLSGKWSSLQTIYNNKPYFGMIFRRHRIRGQGLVLQIKVTSVDGVPFDIMGWSTLENVNAGV